MKREQRFKECCHYQPLPNYFINSCNLPLFFFKKQAASKSYNTFRQVLIKNYIKRNTNLCAMFPAQKAVT